MTLREVIHLTWAQIDEFMDDVARSVIRDAVPDLVVAVSRGGLIPAVILSHRMAIADLAIVRVPRSTATEPSPSDPPHPPAPTASIDSFADRHVLLIDDLCASGRTLERALTLISASKPATLRAAVCVRYEHPGAPLESVQRVARLRASGLLRYIAHTTSGGLGFPWEDPSEAR